MYPRGIYGPNMMGQMGTPFMRGAGRGFGLAQNLRGLKTVSGGGFGSLLNSASKALGVVNQAIPLVKEAGPMFSNMRSMLKLASVFKDETDNSPKNNKSNNLNSNSSSNDSNRTNLDNTDFDNYSNYNYQDSPNFFL